MSVAAADSPEVVQATGDDHRDIRETILEVAQHIFHDATDLDPRQSVLNADPRARQRPVVAFLAGRQFPFARLFFGSRSSATGG